MLNITINNKNLKLTKQNTKKQFEVKAIKEKNGKLSFNENSVYADTTKIDEYTQAVKELQKEA